MTWPVGFDGGDGGAGAVVDAIDAGDGCSAKASTSSSRCITSAASVSVAAAHLLTLSSYSLSVT